MARLPMHPPNAEWWDDDVEGTEIGPYLASGQEASVSAWLEMSTQGGGPSDLSGGQHAHYPAGQVGDVTVDPQNLILQPNAFGMDFSGQASGPDFGTPFPGGSLETCHLGQLGYYGTALADTPNLPATCPEFDPCSPAGEFIPGESVFPVTLPSVSHDLDN